MSQSLRIVFAGTPHFAAQHLACLLEEQRSTNRQHQVIGVYTQPDRPAGRGKKLSASPVKTLALEHSIAVFQPSSLKSAESQAELSALNPDLMVVVAYGLLLPQAVLDIPRLGCINVHASILPRWRGAAPIQRAIEAGDHESGVTIMQMEAGLDTGPMLNIARCPIEATETASSLHDKLSALGQSALLETLTNLANGQVKPEIQDDALATYAKKIDKKEALINWQEHAQTIERKIRAFSPFPGCHTLLNGQRIKVFSASMIEQTSAASTNSVSTNSASTSAAAPGSIVSISKTQVVVACGKNLLALEVLQLPGKKPNSLANILNGNADIFSVGQAFNHE